MVNMTYAIVRWRHSFEDEPIWIYSELDEIRMESRKVELFADGRCGYADKDEAFGGTELAYVPYPDLKEIAADPQFEPRQSTAEEFEEVWRRRKDGNSAGWQEGDR